jgi:hypothetical protein
MWKVLLVIASVVLGGALYLSFDNMGVFKQKQVDIEVEKKKIAELTVSLDKTSAEVTQLEQSIQMLTDEASTLQTAKIDLDAKVVEAEANQKAQQANFETAKADLEKAKALGGDIAAVEAIQKEMVQIRTQIEEAEIEVTQLEGAVASAQVERDRLEKVAAELAALRVDQEAGVIRGEFQSQIKNAYNQWGFVVVAGGNDQGVVGRSQMDVYRRGQPICRLLVTSVEPSQSIAEIVPGSLTAGQRVQVGDTVVKTPRAQTPAVVPNAGATGATPPAGGAAPAPGAPAAAPDPFGGGGMAPSAAPAAPDPFGAAPAPAPAAPDPFGGGGMAPSAAPATPDPFGAPPAPGATPAPSAPGAAPAAPDPFGAPPAAPGATPAPAASGAAPAAPDPFQ